jgi:hypothetical protein
VGSLAWSLSRSTPALEEASSAPVSWPPSALDPLSGRDERGPLPCCESGSCKSGYPCGAGDCSARLPERWWRLRITGVAARTTADEAREDSFSEDLSHTHPRARVCVRRAGTGEPEVCSPLAKAAATKDGDRVNRARLSTSDLERGGVEIRIEENGKDIVSHTRSGPVKGGHYLITVLCRGITLYIGPKETAQMRVFGYLDAQ